MEIKIFFFWTNIYFKETKIQDDHIIHCKRICILMHFNFPKHHSSSTEWKLLLQRYTLNYFKITCNILLAMEKQK